MKRFRNWAGTAVLILAGLLTLAGCHKKSTPSGSNSSEWDIDAKGLPKFVRTNYIDLASIARISKFRSAAGHDYTHDDYLEHCRSMKHYFWPKGGDPGMSHTPSWTTLAIVSPVTGTVARLMPEFAGTQIWLTSDQYPAFDFRIFHVNLPPSLKEGDRVTEGQILGTHGGDETMSDIAVRVITPKGWRLVSYFDVMTDSLFQSYGARGVSARSQMIITKEARDADSLTCSGETFMGSGALESWVPLN